MLQSPATIDISPLLKTFMPALIIEKLTKTYANGVQALRGIDLRVEQGDFFALLGPNGAGKSTVIGILTSLVNKTSGKISILGQDIDTAFDIAKTFLGVVPQEFNFSIFEKVINIVVNQAGYYGVPQKLALERAEFYLQKLGLWEKRHHQSRTLSGGMKRRLMIARALIHQPKILILDEPTAGVDIEIRRSMWQFLTEINQQGITVILTTHYLEEAENLCKNIAIIHNGVIIENTSMKKLLNKLDVESFILNLQEKINHAPLLPSFDCRLLDDYTISIDVNRNQTLNILFQELDEQGITVTSMRNKVNRLEELFVNLTLGNNGSV